MGLKLPAQLGEKGMKRVVDAARLEPGEQLGVVYDSTTLGSARCGLAITDRRAILYDKGTINAIELRELDSVRTATQPTSEVTHALELVARSGATIETVVYLRTADLEYLHGFIRAGSGPHVDWKTGPKSNWELRVNRGDTGFVLSTTPTIEGRPIRTYLGVVSGEAVVGVHFSADFVASIRDVIGGRVESYESELMDAREAAFTMLEEAALELGANAVVGIDVDYEVLGSNGSMMMVSVNGTAVVLT